jgi:hypothetical protein
VNDHIHSTAPAFTRARRPARWSSRIREVANAGMDGQTSSFCFPNPAGDAPFIRDEAMRYRQRTFYSANFGVGAARGDHSTSGACTTAPT